MTKKQLILIVLFCFVLNGIAFGRESIQNKVQDFVEVVYQNYAAELFAKVYEVMHPSIQAVLSKEEYLGFQEYHFRRLSLRISEIKVDKVSKNVRVPSSLRELLSADSRYEFYGVGLSYRAHFVSGVRLNQDVSKTVFVAVSNPGTKEESIYLLWDPGSIEEEEQEDDGN